MQTFTATAVRSGHPAPATPRPAGVGFAGVLARHGGRPALVGPDGAVVDYAELADRVRHWQAKLGPTRRLVAVELAHDPEGVAAYLAGLAGGHPVLLLAPGDDLASRRIRAAWQPDVVIGRSGDGAPWELHEHCPGTAHDLHPDLALLLSTSGSTGSPKLVRLSRTNVESNAWAIATSLGLQTDDRAITSLPLHYCYGLSVLHSHLAVGASVSLTDRSVVDACFWGRMTDDAVTTLAGVPHTFDLLDRVGFTSRRLPALRRVTQAGGRLDPDHVRRLAAAGAARGWDLYVMYGQTEATARMAWLKPTLAARHPECIGQPIDGGAFEVQSPTGDRLPDGEIGELVYRGPNVMLGYASTPADLGRGATVAELRTGDLGRRTSSGLWQVTGRASRFIKPFGLRIDLDELETGLRRSGIVATCAGDDDGVAVAVEPSDDAASGVMDVVRAHTGLPTCAVAAVEMATLPRLANGKPDHAAVLRQCREAHAPSPAIAVASTPTPAHDTSVVRAALASVLGVSVISDDDTFVDLGGDSLSYVETSLRLEATIGRLPVDWHQRSVASLEALAADRASSCGDRTTGGVADRGRRRLRTMDTDVVLRAVAITLVVVGHTEWFVVMGGAHVLLAIAGYNMARFLAPRALPASTASPGAARHPNAPVDPERTAALHRTLTSAARILVPTLAWLAIQFTYAEPLEWRRVLLIHSWWSETPWEYWYLEALLQLMIVLGLVLWIPAVRRLEASRPWLFAAGFVAVGLLARFALHDPERIDAVMFRPDTVLWLFAIGWAVARARRPWHRVALSAAAVAAVPGFFDHASRGAVVTVGLLALIWLRRLPVPPRVHRLVAVVAAASLATYLTHWAVIWFLAGVLPAWAVFAVSMGVGVAVWAASSRVRGPARWLVPA